MTVFIREDLKRIKRKKLGKRVSDVFSCLIITPKEEKPKEIPLVVRLPKTERKLLRNTRRLEYLDRLYSLNKQKVFTDKRIRRYVRLLGLFQRQVPTDIQEYFNRITPTKKVKVKKVKIRVKYKNGAPRKYVDYIQSKYWEKRKTEYYKKYGRKCFICKEVSYVELHHIVYGNFGNEKDEHLVPFCKYHHVEYHAQYKTKRSMVKETLQFIADETDKLIKI